MNRCRYGEEPLPLMVKDGYPTRSSARSMAFVAVLGDQEWAVSKAAERPLPVGSCSSQERSNWRTGSLAAAGVLGHDATVLVARLGSDIAMTGAPTTSRSTPARASGVASAAL